tara:strand:+ start:19690 stop:20259 length:570 start_codon:yes stop_codon:yes gene_type:complete
MKTTLLSALVVSAPVLSAAPFIDEFADASNISSFGVASELISGGELSVTRTSSTGDAGIDWYIDQSTYFSLDSGDAQYILEIDPVAAIGDGEWSPYILFFDNLNGYISELQLTGFSASTSTLSENISEFAVNQSVAGAAQYLVRIRFEGTSGSGFEFSEFAAVPEPSQSALIGGVLALGALLVVRRRRS